MKFRRRAFAIENVEEARFSDGKVIRCPFCEYAMPRHAQPSFENLAGQISRTSSGNVHNLPSLGSDPNDVTIDPLSSEIPTNEGDAIETATGDRTPVAATATAMTK